jgi:NAD(P)-dependent dehydrogenase (short-subunit alcohol dehydrogenase family)
VAEELIGARQQLMETYGSIDGLVNGAGGNMPTATVQPADDLFNLDMAGLKQVIDLNLHGTLLPTQVFGQAMVRSGGGSIVNISSMASQRAITKVLGYSLA